MKAEKQNQEYLDYIFKDHKNTKTYSVKVGRVNVFGWSYHNRFGWFKIFGKGIKWKDTSIHRLMFSERNGYKKGLKIGRWYISLLTR